MNNYKSISLKDSADEIRFWDPSEDIFLVIEMPRLIQNVQMNIMKITSNEYLNNVEAEAVVSKAINKFFTIKEPASKGVMVELIKKDENDILMEEVEQENLTLPELKLEEIDKELL